MKEIITNNKKQLETKKIIYLRGKTEPNNKYLSSILYEKFIDDYRNYNPGYFVSKNELIYLRKQLEEHILIDFTKIESPIIKEYIKPIEVKNAKGHYIQTRESLADWSKIKYSISKPIYSSDGNFAYIYVSRDRFGDMIKIFKYQNNKWKFFKNIGLSIY